MTRWFVVGMVIAFAIGANLSIPEQQDRHAVEETQCSNDGGRYIKMPVAGWTCLKPNKG